MLKLTTIQYNLEEDNIKEISLEKYGSEDIIFKTIKFNDKDEAKDYLNDVCQEGKIVFVKYLDVVEDIEENKGLTDLKERLEEETKTLNNFPTTIINKLKEQTSGSKGCKVCKSSYNKDYLIKFYEEQEELDVSNMYCPMCKDKHFLFNSSEEKRLGNIKKRIQSITEKIEEKELKLFAKAKKQEVGLLAFNEPIVEEED